ncbi:MAG TPA: hypothetical protein VG796_08315 [Verrucomicrobiales bacterium]|nr:hypothetical protein [Verrucomicrobiales bacterium]
MKSLDWRLIRTWNGSQYRAFEELCCQVARTEMEHLPKRSRFFRRGTPDGGVECHWELPNGEILGWQAKFVTESPRTKLWSELDDSVKTAIERNPTLSRYTVCLPQSLPDERRTNKKSARQRWDEHVSKWEGWAEDQNRKIEFVLWDESILLEFLVKPVHIGRRAFWFGGPAFTQQWFSDNGVRPAVRQANKRYTPPLHIDLPIQQTIAFLRRDSAFHQRLREEADSIRDAMEDCLGSLLTRASDSGLITLKLSLQRLAEVIASWSGTIYGSLDAHGALSSLTGVRRAVATTATEIQRREEQSKENRSYDAGRLWHFHDVLIDAEAFVKSSEVNAALSGRLIVTGGAGSGKTHLFCKVAEISLQENRPVLLMLGEQFEQSEEPWTRIMRLMGLSCGRDEFLGALDASGEASGCRALILLDGLNEGPGIAYWRRHLGAILEHLKPWPHVALGLSLRDAYEGDIRKVVGQDAAWTSHTGFRGKAGEAARHFFRHYQLAEPNMPVLDPEYENPLFLKLLCESLSRQHGLSLSDPPSFRELLQMVLNDANEQIAVELDYDPSERYVHRAVARIAELMRQEGESWLEWSQVREELNKLKPSESHSRSLAQRLIGQDLLVRAKAPYPNGEEDRVRFTYQRFSDFILVEEWLLQERTAGRDGTALLQEWEANAEWDASARTWLEAAATISPEIGGPELPDLIPGAIEYPALRSAFLHSIVWRPRRTVTTATKIAVLSLLERRDEARADTFDTLLAVTSRPNHSLNADWLDNFLRPFPMPERDSIWSTSIFGGWDSEGNVHRLIEWAWQENAGAGLGDEIVRLSSQSLVWMLTTSDRFVRDRATKALVSLLENRLEIMRWLLGHFADVPEPYVQERLYAVAYGCALRTADLQGLWLLAQEVYDRIFRNGNPPPNVLLRDHARSLVDTARRKGARLDFFEQLTIPPYSSEPPSEPPAIDDLKKAFHYDDWTEKGHGSSSAIYHSVTDHDFNWYTLTEAYHWSGELRSGSLRRSPRRLFQALLARLPENHAEIVMNLADCYARVSRPWADETDRSEIPPIIELTEKALPRLIGKPRARLLLTRIRPYLRDRRADKFSSHFDKRLFVRLVLQRIIEYGWRSELFGDFDREVSSQGRSTRKAERIGKKYQWMAYYELLARISDNFGPADDETPAMSQREWECGLWPTGERDLDPSLLIRSTKRDGWGVNHVNWWTPHRYASWHSKPRPAEWLRSADDIPNPEEFLSLRDPKGEEWLLLEGFHEWERKFVNDEAWQPERDRQKLHYLFRSYLVKTEHLEAILKWGRRQNWINDRLPKPEHFFHVHLHEHYESPLFDTALEDDLINDWRSGDSFPHPIVRTSAEYMCEHNVYDCSLDYTVLLALPSRWLARKAGIHISGRNGDFVAPNGRLIAFDPSTREKGQSVVLFKKSALLETLARERMAIFWTLLGEKNIYPPELNRDPWLGRLTLLGIYSWKDSKIVAELRTEFQDGRG